MEERRMWNYFSIAKAILINYVMWDTNSFWPPLWPFQGVRSMKLGMNKKKTMTCIRSRQSCCICTWYLGPKPCYIVGKQQVGKATNQIKQHHSWHSRDNSNPLLYFSDFSYLNLLIFLIGWFWYKGNKKFKKQVGHAILSRILSPALVGAHSSCSSAFLLCFSFFWSGFLGFMFTMLAYVTRDWLIWNRFNNNIRSYEKSYIWLCIIGSEHYNCNELVPWKSLSCYKQCIRLIWLSWGWALYITLLAFLIKSQLVSFQEYQPQNWYHRTNFQRINC